MFKQISALILSLGLSANVFAADKINANLKKVSQKYRAAKVVEMNIEKTVKSDLTGKLDKFTGTVAIANEKFRIDTKTPDEALLLFDGTTLWNVQYPPKEFGGPAQVAKGKPDKKTRALMLAATLLGGDIQKTFKVTNEKKDGDIVTLSVASKDDLPVKNIQMVLDMKKQEIKEISYTDEIPNFVTMKFSDVKLKDSIKKNLFKYEIPKDAQVTNL
ncbi:outer membrane lipoprotein carrier protein LolA [Bdellovibrio sp. SKB1291214]|uniref:LolA family protein n=1 Tax=Bdellovibrio sp. SKB1291214 TaxID=1732569 RepID=UPI000B51C167|nr:outer membrane lipoprotein carrier protein LolA [Bdellovibrio sp. SKB1291214]UYL10615.1 outer membrane lipoprotein carrier protein LolA [Bdellovibrio sp. SKB1291214]